MVGIFQVIGAIDAYVVPDTAILVYDGIAYIATFSYSEFGQSTLKGMGHFLDGLKIVGAHQAAVDDGGSMSYPAANTDHAGLDATGVDDAAFGNDGPFQRSAADLGGRQHAGTGINGARIIEKIKRRYFFGKGQVGFKERID